MACLRQAVSFSTTLPKILHFDKIPLLNVSQQRLSFRGQQCWQYPRLQRGANLEIFVQRNCEGNRSKSLKQKFVGLLLIRGKKGPTVVQKITIQLGCDFRKFEESLVTASILLFRCLILGEPPFIISDKHFTLPLFFM